MTIPTQGQPDGGRRPETARPVKLPSRNGGTGTAAPRILVNMERCVGCQECVIRCPTGALDLDPGAWKAAGTDALCVGCRQCVRTCPFGAIEIEGPVLAPPRVAVQHPAVTDLAGSTAPTRRGFAYAEALQEAERCLQCPDPTCVLGCPAHNDIPAFIAAIREEDWEGAHAALRPTTVLPDICSIVCDQSLQCEGACSWKLAGGEPVAIGLLERFVTEQQPVPEVRAPEATTSGQRVAIVGSGPAGMAAAWELLESGATVSMFERENDTGGVLSWGIPNFTLPESVARRPMEALVRAGLDVRMGIDVDDAALERMRSEYDAVILAQGASNPARLPVPGADAKGVEDATRFLRRARLALLDGRRNLPDLPPDTHVLVVGAGNTAMDVARSARRLGCEATAIDWFDRRFAAVRDDELDEAESEGVRIAFNRVVERFDVDEAGRVVGAVLSHTRQKKSQAKPTVVRGTSERLDVGLVVLATGYRVGGPWPHGVAGTLPARVPDLRNTVPPRTLLGSGLPAGSRRIAGLVRRRMALESRSEAPVAASVWVAGDALSGPSTVVASMAQGRAAAREVLRTVVGDHARPASSHGARAADAVVRRTGDGRRVPAAGGTWVPKASLSFGLAAEVAGVSLAAASGAWPPAAALFGVGTVAALVGLNGWVGGWVRMQER